MTEKQVISKLFEFGKSELKFKQIHENYNGESVLENFEGDFKDFVTDAMDNSVFVDNIKWYSPIANYTYPRMLHAEFTKTLKNNRYHLPFLHIHDFHEFIYVMQGECEQSINKKAFLAKQGEFYYIAPGTKHSVYSNTDNSIVINFCILASDMEKVFAVFEGKNKMINENISLMPNSNKCTYIKFNDKNGNIRRAIINLYKHIFEKEGYMTALTIAALIEILAVCDEEKLIEETEKSTVNNGMLMYEIIKYIKENFRDVTLNELSERFHFTPNYMSRMIKKETGKTFKEIVNDIKVNEAYKHILTTKLRMIDIAYEVGFNSQEHFTRVFMKHKNINPLQLRKS